MYPPFLEPSVPPKCTPLFWQASVPHLNVPPFFHTTHQSPHPLVKKLKTNSGDSSLRRANPTATLKRAMALPCVPDAPPFPHMQNRPQRRSQPSAGFSRNVRNRIPCRCVLPISEPPVEVFIDHQKGTVFTPERIFRLYCALRTHPSADHSQVTFARLRSHSLAHPGSSLSPRLRSAPFANSSRPSTETRNRRSQSCVARARTRNRLTQLHLTKNQPRLLSPLMLARP